MEKTVTTCKTQGVHLFGANGKCVFCKARRPDVIDEMTIDQQKKLLADTFADSVLPLIDTVLRKRCEQWVEEIYAGLHKEEKQ